MHVALLHYHEIALKGRNRGFFEQRLVHHLRSAFRGTGIDQIEALPGRVRITLKEGVSWETVQSRVQRTFGVVNFSLAKGVPISRKDPNLTALCEAIRKDIAPLSFQTFRLTTKRADKRFPKTSLDVDREIGAHLCQQTGKRVNLGNPDLTIHVELLTDIAYYSLEKERGPGGLPTGISGTVACLTSGGIDSPVAAYRMMKRGCKVVFIHFHGRPYLSRASEEKVKDLVTHLTRYQLRSRLYLVPFGNIQRAIVLDAPPPFRVVLYRRMMMRIAETLANREHAWGLVTGDSLGQVASQTPENLQVISEVPQLPILRPLIGMDKQEITEQAQQIGTFETSIEPDQDCCTLFVPPHPSTKSRLDEIEHIEQTFAIPGMVQEGIDGTEVMDFQFP
ncbi:MAG: tRNA 4-thiouridine(8) synthase ThiI [Nitrospirales bacterium]|nr:tRNA 4-thiouridine(8) synthase ThiI [Nitrospirales bacterium]